MTEIKLFNPSDQPFGMLSNNAYHMMVIDDIKYPTVTNYLLSHMLINPLHRQVIQTMDIKGSKSGINKSLLSAIDYLLDYPSEKSIKPFRDVMIKRLVEETGNPIDYFKDWGDIELKNRYDELNIKKVGKIDTENKRLKDKIRKYKKEGTTKAEQKVMMYEEQLRILEAKQEKEGWEAMEEVNEKEDKISEKKYREKLQKIQYISKEVKKPFESINLVELKDKIIREAEINQSDIYQLHQRYEYEETVSTIRNALEKGFTERFKDPEFASLLLKTNGVIQYVSQDSFLGIGHNGEGLNLVGKSLMQVRRALKIKEKKIEKDQEQELKYKNIYNVYLAYMILKKELYENKNTLKKYVGMDPENIINIYGLQNLGSIPSQEAVIDLYKNQFQGPKYKSGQLNPIILEEIFRPGFLVTNFRKNELKTLQTLLKEDKKNIIFKMYLKYMINKKYDNLTTDEVDRAISDYIDYASNEQMRPIRALKERVVDLFNLGMLSASLSDDIDIAVKNLNIPTDEEISESQLEQIKPPVSPPKRGEEDSSRSSESSDEDREGYLLKTMLKDDDKQSHKDLVNIIISMKGGQRSMYKDWSKDELRERIEGLKESKFGRRVELAKNIEPEVEGDIVQIFQNEQNKSFTVSRNFEKYGTLNICPFIPDEYTGMIVIDSRAYPTLKHYMSTRLIANTGTKRTVGLSGKVKFEKGVGIKVAYDLILTNPPSSTEPEDFIPIELLQKIYDDMEVEAKTILLGMLVVISLNKKFEDISLRELLRLTGDATILWNDPHNYYLGAGDVDHVGNNYVGKVLMDIRHNIAKEPHQDILITIEESDILQLIQKDDFMNKWIKMTLKDMCNTVHKFQQYILKKQGEIIDLNTTDKMVNLVTTVLNKIFQPCGVLSVLSKKINFPVPDFFVWYVSKCSGIPKIEQLKKVNNNGLSVYNNEIQKEHDRMTAKLYELQDEYGGYISTIKRSFEESTIFNDNQRKKFSEFMDDNNRGVWSEPDGKGKKQWIFDLTLAERNKNLKEFKQKQAEEYDEFHGKVTSDITKEERRRYKNKESEIKNAFNEYLRKQVKKYEKMSSKLKTISQLYWNRIVVMVTLLIQNVKQPTKQKIKQSLISLEEMSSAECSKPDDCIVSALINLLHGIHQFKIEFSRETLDVDDVNLAGSIIMNNDYDAKMEYYSDESKSDESFEVGEEGLFPTGQSIGHSIGEGEVRDDGDNSGENSPLFGFSPDPNNEQYNLIKTEVELISKYDSDNITLAILDMVSKINKHKMDPKIKQNRINFFATK